MAPMSPLREFRTPTGRKIQKEASISSMERALRTLSPPSSLVPQTPRRNNGNSPRRRRRSSNSTVKKPSRDRSTRSGNNGGEEAVRVAIRMRPLAPGGDQCAGRAWRASSEQNSIVDISTGSTGRSVHNSATPRPRRSSGETEYVYDRVFGEDANTCEIYNELVADMVESVTKEGINGTVFTYGQTSSGKTFTMQGCADPDSSVGIIQLAAKEIFQSIKEEKSDGSNTECSVRVSYVEIYNEELRDLLSDGTRKSPTSLIIREDKRGSISVEGLKEVAVESLAQLMEVFRSGELNKSVGSTKMNDRSSRSHAILKIMLERKTVLKASNDAEDKENAVGPNAASDLVVKTTSALNLVDLAGSESVRHTGASGMQKKEGGMINQSLLTLSKVLMSLGQKNPGHINYRDSKLTRILKPSLSGNARMAVICCISPSDKYIEETRSTLQFATRAKLVKTNAVANEEVEDADLIAKLRLESAKARLENQKLSDKLRKLEATNVDNVDTERCLANLKRFVLGEKIKPGTQPRISPEQHALAPVCFADDHFNLWRRSEATPPISSLEESKDDLYLHLFRESIENNSLKASTAGDLLRVALDFKAKQVKSLQAKLATPRKESKAKKDKRYSLISELRSAESERRMSRINEAQSPNDDRRISFVNEARSPNVRKSKSDSDGIEYYQDQIDQLETKLANANSFVSDLEHQIEELSSQKNDALDWIEELFAKADQKDEKARQAIEEKNVAIKRCEELEVLLKSTSRDLELLSSENEKLHQKVEDANIKINSMGADFSQHDESADKIEELYLELATAKEKYETSQDSLSQVRMENRQLLQDQRTADIKLNDLEAEIVLLKSERVDILVPAQSLPDTTTDNKDSSEMEKANAELKNQVQELKDFNSEYAEEKKSLVQQIEMYEEELCRAEALLKSKSDELDDAMFSLEKVNSNATQLSLSGMEQKHDTDQDVALAVENEKLRIMVEELKFRCQKMDELSIESRETRQQLDEERRQRMQLSEEASALEEDMKKVSDEKLQLEEDYNECMQKLGNMTGELMDARQKLDYSNENKSKLTSEEEAELKEEIRKMSVEHHHVSEKYNASLQQVDDLSKELEGVYQQLEESKELCHELRLQVDDMKIQSHDVDDLKEENKKLVGEKLRLTNEYNECVHKMDNIFEELSNSRRQLDDSKHLVKEVALLKEDNEKLRTQLDRLSKDFNTYLRKASDLSIELSLAHQQLEDAKERGDAEAKVDVLKDENLRLTNDYNECMEALRDSQQKLEEANDHNHEMEGLKSENTRLRALREKSEDRLSRVETEKSELVDHLNAANARIKELFGQVQVTKKEMNLQKKAKEQLRGSVEKIQPLVDALSSENADLKEKNESLGRARECLENRSRELQCLLSNVTTERDIACDERNNLMESRSSLLSKFNKLCNERDAAMREKDGLKKKLDKIAADFEADYETVRSKVDSLLIEKKTLEEKITFLEASKASVEDNADRILQRDNNLAAQYDRLKVEFKKQTMRITELDDEVSQLVQRLSHLKSENDRISRDNSALKDIIHTRPVAERFDEPNGKKRAKFGFMHR